MANSPTPDPADKQPDVSADAPTAVRVRTVKLAEGMLAELQAEIGRQDDLSQVRALSGQMGTLLADAQARFPQSRHWKKFTEFLRTMNEVTLHRLRAIADALDNAELRSEHLDRPATRDAFHADLHRILRMRTYLSKEELQLQCTSNILTRLQTLLVGLNVGEITSSFRERLAEVTSTHRPMDMTQLQSARMFYDISGALPDDKARSATEPYGPVMDLLTTRARLIDFVNANTKDELLYVQKTAEPTRESLFRRGYDPDTITALQATYRSTLQRGNKGLKKTLPERMALQRGLRLPQEIRGEYEILVRQIALQLAGFRQRSEHLLGTQWSASTGEA